MLIYFPAHFDLKYYSIIIRIKYEKDVYIVIIFSVKDINFNIRNYVA